MYYATQRCATELTFTSHRAYADPFNQVDVEVGFHHSGGRELRVPAFWAGGSVWKVRFAPPVAGVWAFRTSCTDTSNTDLHDVSGEVSAAAYQGGNPLLQHGGLRAAADGRHLEHEDGTPFFWLGDTWWMALTSRLTWPDEFRELVADRAAKGFSVIQIVAGLYPDMEPFDPRGANEGGQAWEASFARVNPGFFDVADLRLAHLVSQGLMPCIVGSWGYYMQAAGLEILRRHWRYLIARYGCYPVVWCLAGEALMDYYLAPVAESERAAHQARLRAAWGDLARYVRATDPYARPITIHPTRFGHEQIDDPSLLSIDMLQTGHSGFTTLGPTVGFLEEALAHRPPLPVLVGEVNYEGIIESSREEMQRFAFWTCMLSGACGHTYGANGLWQVNRRERPYGASPHGTSWGNRPWDEAYRLPGSKQLGLGKRLLERYDWWRLEPASESVEPHQNADNRLLPYAARVPGQVHLVFVPADAIWRVWSGGVRVALRHLTPRRGFWFDPCTGDEYELGLVRADEDGWYQLPRPPIFQDWVVVIEG